jgi:hypothetical protein
MLFWTPFAQFAMDALHRAFLWNAADRACLVAWDAVCRPKQKVGWA